MQTHLEPLAEASDAGRARAGRRSSATRRRSSRRHGASARAALPAHRRGPRRVPDARPRSGEHARRGARARERGRGADPRRAARDRRRDRPHRAVRLCMFIPRIDPSSSAAGPGGSRATASSSSPRRRCRRSSPAAARRASTPSTRSPTSAARARPAPAGGARLLRLRAARRRPRARCAASRCRRSGTSSRSSTSRTRRRSTGPDAEIPYPAGTQELDYELEVAAVIGAEGAIGGFTVMNDWSARDLQRAEMRVGLGPAKGKDFATSLGPVVVTVDEFPGDEARDGRARERRGALARQPARPPLLVGAHPRAGGAEHHACARATCSAPAPSARAASSSSSDGRWLQRGDVVELEVEGIGVLRNTIA